MQLRAATAADHEAIRRVVTAAFGQADEANLVADLRAGGDVRLEAVAEDGGEIVGHLLYGELRVETPTGPASGWFLAPLAVVPPMQRRGIGSALVRNTLATAAAAGARFVIVLGEPEYYGRFGFNASLAAPLESPYAGPYFQALELVPGALAGVAGRVIYPAAFG